MNQYFWLILVNHFWKNDYMTRERQVGKFSDFQVSSSTLMAEQATPGPISPDWEWNRIASPSSVGATVLLELIWICLLQGRIFSLSGKIWMRWCTWALLISANRLWNVNWMVSHMPLATSQRVIWKLWCLRTSCLPGSFIQVHMSQKTRLVGSIIQSGPKKP